MLRLVLAYGLLAATSALAQAPPAEPTQTAAGVIEFVEGDGLVEAKDGRARVAKVGDPVYPADTVTTFTKAELHLKMADGAYFSVRENTKLTITEYVANGDDGDRSLVDLARGAFRSITGWIGRTRSDNYRVRTPMVTIGVRGTDHEPTHLLPGDPRGEPGSYDKVNEGRTVMRSPLGSTEVAPNRAAFFHTDHRQAPRLLASVPTFFRPARNEQRFQQRAQASVRTLDTQRQQRREAFRKTRGPTYAPGASPTNKGIPQTAPRSQFSPEKAPKKEGAPKPAAKEAAKERMAQKQRFIEEKKAAAKAPHPQKKGEKGDKKNH
jgi:hypothetical protein